MKITAIQAIPLSYWLPEGKTVTMGMGRTPNPTRADRFSSRKTVQYWGSCG
jgi:hypothetical protein